MYFYRSLSAELVAGGIPRNGLTQGSCETPVSDANGLKAAIRGTSALGSLGGCRLVDEPFGNPIEGATNDLATRVSTPGRVRASLRWARDRGASVSKRGLTLTLVTPWSYAGPLLSRNGRGFHNHYDDLLPAFPLHKSLFFISDGLAFLGQTRLTVHTG
jgi:hypothetical protein